MLLVIALAAALHAFFVTEVRLVIDGDHVRLSEQDVAFGSRRENKLLWELPLAELTEHALGSKAVPASRQADRGGRRYRTRIAPYIPVPSWSRQ